MKKFIALLLALMMVSVCAAALAEDPPKPMYQFNADGIVTLTKSYTVSGNDKAVNPADVLTFSVAKDKIENATAGTTFPTPDVSIGNVTVNKGAETATISIQLPEYTAVGEYYYKITENDTGVAGVTYLADEITMKVQVFNGENGGLDRYVTFRINEQKVDGFVNKYEAGTLTVSKTVSGNMGDLNKKWNFTVVFTAPSGDTVMGDITTSASEGATAPATIAAGTTGWSGDTTKTASFKLVSGQSVTFSNIPKGVTYTVAEAEAGADGYITKVGDTELKKATDTVSGNIAGSENDTVAITNTKTVDVDTGVTLDSAVYMLIMALAVAGFVALKIRRREDY